MYTDSALTSHSMPVLRVKGLVNLVKQVKRGRVTLLDGKDESEGHQRLLPSRELL